MNLRKILCSVGAHKFDRREIHIQEPLHTGMTEAKMCVIEKCPCGVYRFAWNGVTLPTKLIAPASFNAGDKPPQVGLD